MKSFLIHIGTDFPAILFFILLLWRIRRSGTGEKSLVSQESSVSLRGIAALSVLLYHLAPTTENGSLLPKFYSFGAGGLAVAFFFFLSGYGLQKQYILHRDSYRRSFFKKRIPNILIPLILFVVIYRLTYFALGKTYTFQNLISDIRIGIPFVAHSWYLITILLFYLFFWLMMTVLREHVFWMPIISCGWYLLYAFICIKLKYLMFWFDTAHLLPFGMLCAVHEQKILNALNKKWIYYSVFAASFLSFFLVIPAFYSNGLTMNIQLFFILTISRGVLFTTIVLLLQHKIKNDNPVLRYFGKISLEIYLIHGLVFYLLRGDYYYLTNEPLYCLLSLSIVILIASILAPVDRFLLRSWKRIVK